MTARNRRTQTALARGEQTWTFVGHWDNDRIVVEYVLDGDQEDTREDAGFWPQGLWAAAASGNTEEEAQARAIAEYEPTDQDEEEVEAPVIHYPTLSYAESGVEPTRVLVQSADGAVTQMMTEIKPGLFVAWVHCFGCGLHIRECDCAGGPVEPRHIARWRSERPHSSPSSIPMPAQNSTTEAYIALPRADDQIAQQIDTGLDTALDAVRASTSTDTPTEVEPEGDSDAGF